MKKRAKPSTYQELLFKVGPEKAAEAAVYGSLSDYLINISETAKRIDRIRRPNRRSKAMAACTEVIQSAVNSVVHHKKQLLRATKGKTK
ncbi:MAG: hypothetical protein FWD15_03795 [Alphaproteobacteria bacterium]|nr:hypothetical protein [Alphaproteobacteria bacterium]